MSTFFVITLLNNFIFLNEAQFLMAQNYAYSYNTVISLRRFMLLCNVQIKVLFVKAYIIPAKALYFNPHVQRYLEFWDRRLVKKCIFKLWNQKPVMMPSLSSLLYHLFSVNFIAQMLGFIGLTIGSCCYIYYTLT